MSTTTIQPDPHYTVTVRVDDQQIDQQEIDDPFVNSTLVIHIGFWDAVKSLVRRGGIDTEVVVDVTGDREALMHVMNVRPLIVQTGEPALSS